MIRIVRYKRGGWEVDIRVRSADGRRLRERVKSPVSSKTGTARWAQNRERLLMLQVERPPVPVRAPAPTLEKFGPQFLERYATANRQKPSGIAAKKTILDIHLYPIFGRKRLDQITDQDVQRLKGKLKGKAVKTVNNVLTVLKTLLRVAVQWGVIERAACTVELLRSQGESEASYYDFDEYERLVTAARKLDRRAHLIVLLGGEAGLRLGEMLALEWADLDLSKRQLWVKRSEWKGEVSVPKSGRPRLVPLTARLAEALTEARHLRSPRVLCTDRGHSYTMKIVRNQACGAARIAGLAHGGVHILRHTFCSHLAMRGAPARAIQELAGHQDLKTTLRYMHLSPSAMKSAVDLLDDKVRGDVGETGYTQNVN